MLVSLVLFVTGLKLMQAGARVFGPLLERSVDIDSPIMAFAFTGLTDTIGCGTSLLGDALEGTPMDEAAEAAGHALPAWGVFLVGLAVIIGSFKLFDLSVPGSDEAQGALERLPHRIYGR